MRTENEPVLQGYLRSPQWVGVRPELQPAYERGKLDGGLLPQERAGGRRTLVHSEVGALREILVARLTSVVLDLVEQLGE